MLPYSPHCWFRLWIHAGVSIWRLFGRIFPISTCRWTSDPEVGSGFWAAFIVPLVSGSHLSVSVAREEYKK